MQTKISCGQFYRKSVMSAEVVSNKLDYCNWRCDLWYNITVLFCWDEFRRHTDCGLLIAVVGKISCEVQWLFLSENHFVQVKIFTKISDLFQSLSIVEEIVPLTEYKAVINKKKC